MIVTKIMKHENAYSTAYFSIQIYGHTCVGGGQKWYQEYRVEAIKVALLHSYNSPILSPGIHLIEWTQNATLVKKIYSSYLKNNDTIWQKLAHVKTVA